MPQRVERYFLWLTILIIAGFSIPRALFFLVSPGAAEDLIGNILIREFQLFLMLMGYTYTYVVAPGFATKIVVLTAVWLALRALYLLNHRDRLIPPELGILTAVLMVFLQFFFDLSPRLTGVLLLELVLYIWIFRQGDRIRDPRLTAPFIVFILSLFALDWAESTAAVIFIVAGLLLHVARVSRKTNLVPAISLLLLFIPLVQILSSFFPGLFAYDKDRQFTALPALSFCESKSLNAIFAAHPQCPMAMFSEKCRNGYIGQYDRQTLAPVRSLRPFDENYYGRAEQIVCNGKVIYAGMNGVRSQGEIFGPNTMIIDLSGEKVKYIRNFAGVQMGNHVLYDFVHDALFMTSEWDQRIYRWDFKRRSMEEHIGDAIPNPWYWPPTGRLHTGSRISHHDAISPRHNTAFFSEWINGRNIHEIDLVSLKLQRTLRFNGGASVGVTVDDAGDKLWVSHLWGVTVFDLHTGKVLIKHRMGFVSRPAVIDAENNFVYMASTVQGRIHVFDRNTLRRLTYLPLGIGSRYLLISPETRRLFASSWSGSYSFDLSAGGSFIQKLEKIRMKN